jgi:hypothetical protein
MYDHEKIDDFHLRAESIAKTLNKDEAFTIILSEINSCDDRYLNEYILALNHVRTDKTLDWIEHNSHRIKNVGINWGHLAAVSFFTWNRADNWLSKGRPLSLIALDALVFCTSHGERLNQSLLLRELNPRLGDNPAPDVVASRLQKYLQTDNVPRTKSSIDKIINNIFETDQ